MNQLLGYKSRVSHILQIKILEYFIADQRTDIIFHIMNLHVVKRTLGYDV